MTAGVDSQWDNVLFLLRVTEEHSLMYEGVGNFGESVQSFPENLGHSIPEQVERTLGNKIGSAVTRQEIFDACKPGDLFEGLTAVIPGNSVVKPTSTTRYAFGVKTVRLYCLFGAHCPMC